VERDDPRSVHDPDLAGPSQPVLRSVQALLDALPVPATVLTVDGDAVAANASARRLFGGVGEPDPVVWAILATQPDVDARFGLVDVDGVDRAVVLTARPFDLDGATGPLLLLTALDETALKAAERELERRATVDTVTGLPNRRQLETHLGLALERHRRHPARLAALHVDLDGLAQAADAFGDTGVEQVLLDVASRLHLALRSGDFAASLGEGRFVVLLEREVRPATPAARRQARRDGRKSPDDIEVVSDRIAAALRVPFDLDAGSVSLVPRIGVAVASEDDDIDELVARAAADQYRVERQERRARLSIATDTP
jgi:diguanylate cyclase (GGDEF)-like protein